MSDLKTIVRALAGPLEAEAQTGYGDAAIIGQGIGQYSRAWAERAWRVMESEEQRKQCLRVRELLGDYGGLAPPQRERCVEAALGLLSQLAGERRRAPRRPSKREQSLAASPPEGHTPESARRAATRPRAKPRSGSHDCEAKSEESFLDQPVRGPGRPSAAWRKRLANLGIRTNRDLLYHFPRDYAPLHRVADLADGQRAAAVVKAKAREATVTREGRGFRLMRYALEVADETGRAWVTSFARVPRRGARAQAIRHSPLTLNHPPGTRLLVEGLVQRRGRFIEIRYGGCERLGAEDQFLPGTLVPIYPLTDGVYQGQLRTTVRRLLGLVRQHLPDPLPDSLRTPSHLPPLVRALKDIHWPSSIEARDAARRRLAFEELLILQLAVAQRKRELQRPGSGISMPPQGEGVRALEQVLPFSLTRAQQRVIAEVAADMASDTPMCRLLQGDVGSGKTVVAAAALLIASQNSYQSALMAPTEILAEQHYMVLSRLLKPLGVPVELLTGSRPRAEREAALGRISTGRVVVAIGTHALIQKGVTFGRLGLVIVDEQHRFGVRQRAELRTKGARPDMLVMTATPIPRTLALTAYGDLEMSVLDEMPSGRGKIETLWFTLQRQREAFALIRHEAAAGRQAYVVYPLIEESEELQAQAATKLAEQLQQDDLCNLRVGLAHGAMRVAEREAVMEAFRAGEIDVLTATTVIEVGVDVPNATIMLILNAERFGLAQLHQLRGRVGRGGQRSYCILVTDRKYAASGPLAPGTEDSLDLARQRLQVIVAGCDGFTIAERDLLLRGPGEFYGTRQHGLPDFRLARLASDSAVLAEARETAFRLTQQDPRLEAAEHRVLRERVADLRARMERLAG